MPDHPHCPPSASVVPHLATNSAKDGVLCITEILRLIFSFLSLRCNTNNARVCKVWCDIAIDNIWHEITDVTCVIKLLAPLCKYGAIQVSIICQI
jgi:hypothetical protein